MKGDEGPAATAALSLDGGSLSGEPEPRNGLRRSPGRQPDATRLLRPNANWQVSTCRANLPATSPVDHRLRAVLFPNGISGIVPETLTHSLALFPAQ